MTEELTELKTSVIEIKTEFKHINKRLDGIDGGMRQIQKLMLKQNDLQRDISGVSMGYAEIKEQLSGFGKRLTDIEDETRALKTSVNDIPKTFKVNVFDYVWKYISVAIGGYIALKISGVLP